MATQQNNEMSYKAYARNTDPEPSHAAADHVTGRGVMTVNEVIIEALRLFPEGLTTVELADVTGLSRVTLSPKCRPLEREGHIVELPKRRFVEGHPTAMIVWALK